LLKENIDYVLKGESRSFIQRFGDINLDYYEVSLNPILNDENNIFGCTFLARNISERIQAENALKESETKFKEVIDQVNDAIIVFDQQGKIVIWNKGAEQLCGLKAEDAINKSIIDIQLQLTPPPHNNRARIEKVINSIIAQVTPEVFDQIIESEVIPLNSDRRLNIQSRVFPIKLNGDYLFCAVIRDNTEIKRYEKELLRISAEKDKFYSTIAQYLYTPFNVFNNFTKSMSEELDSLPIKEIQKMVRMMSKSAGNLYSLLDNLLQWTRIHQGKIPFEPQKLNFKKISLEAFSLLKPNAEAKNIKINHLAGDGIIVFADIFMLKTILRNLVTNAITFANSDGQIDIYAQEAPSNIIISVRYSGITITQDYLTNLLDLSHIHSAFGAPEEKGSTLGLLLCNEFVEKHGGKIWVEGENGKGCEFRFTLPTSAK
jgi:PAS domain S-box-containing protein